MHSQNPTNAPKPTKKQTILLDFIRDFTETNNFSPSYREIMRAMDLSSVSAVAEHINNCVSLGFLKKIEKSARSLEVLYFGEESDYVKYLREIERDLRNDDRKDDAETIKQAIKVLKSIKKSHEEA